MLGIELSALSATELRRLLEAARARGQHSLVRQLEAELAARPGRAPGQTLPMAATPRPVAAPPRPTVYSARRRSRAPAIAVAGLAAFIGAAVAWGLSTQPARAPTLQPQGASLTVEAPQPRVAVALTTRLPEEDPDQPVEEPAAPPIEDRVASAVPKASPGRNPCYDLPTARERLVCGYPSLAIQDRRMKAALKRAAERGEVSVAQERAQSEWLRASANISDRKVLAERYAERVAELETK